MYTYRVSRSACVHTNIFQDFFLNKQNYRRNCVRKYNIKFISNKKQILFSKIEGYFKIYYIFSRPWPCLSNLNLNMYIYYEKKYSASSYLISQNGQPFLNFLIIFFLRRHRLHGSVSFLPSLLKYIILILYTSLKF